MRVPKTYSGAWTRCADCGRVLWVEDGPVCPECKAARAAAKDAPVEEQPAPAPKKRSGG